MWEFFGKVVDVLPAWFIMALIVFLIGTALYMLPRLRKDKNGKWYLFSRSYEYQKNRAKSLFVLVEAMNKRLSSIEEENLKQSFYLETLPKDERCKAGLKYVYHGGNGQVRIDVGKFVRDNIEVYMAVLKEFPQWTLPPEKDMRKAC
jgi:hypothetical protein